MNGIRQYRDEINVDYILALLANLTETKGKEKTQREQQIEDLIDGSVKLRSKKELIEKFIAENIPHIEKSKDVSRQFGQFWSKERVDAFQKLVDEENLKPSELQTVIENYLYTEREPLNDDIVKTLQEKPKLLQRRTKVPRVMDKIVNYVKTFFDGVDEEAA